MRNTVPMTYDSSLVEIRFDPDTMHCWVWAPYNLDFLVDIKLTFCTPAALEGSIGTDKGAEWDSVVKAWHIYTGWSGCEDWFDKLVLLLNRWFPGQPDCNHEATLKQLNSNHNATIVKP